MRTILSYLTVIALTVTAGAVLASLDLAGDQATLFALAALVVILGIAGVVGGIPRRRPERARPVAPPSPRPRDLR